MTLDSLLKGIDPLISSTLDRALSDKEISENQAVELFDSNGAEMNVVVLVADELRRRFEAVGAMVNTELMVKLALDISAIRQS